jgi:hypothetical protein
VNHQIREEAQKIFLQNYTVKLEYSNIEEPFQETYEIMKQATIFEVTTHARRTPSIDRLVDFLLTHPGLRTSSVSSDMLLYILRRFYCPARDQEEASTLRPLMTTLAPLKSAKVVEWHRVYPYFSERHR